MIDPKKIQEWVNEVEARPSSGPVIVGFMARRLAELSQRYEELMAETLQLRSEQKISEYETRIQKLEYQLDLLKRLVGEGTPAPRRETLSLIVYNGRGAALRVEVDLGTDAEGRPLTRLEGAAGARLLLTAPQEELLFLFDSGRTARLAAAALPAASGESLNWAMASVQPPSAGEELAAVVPVGRLALAEAGVQVSRRGFVKKILPRYLETYLASNYLGSGVVQKADRAAGLTLCAPGERFAMASREGALFSMDTGRLPANIEEGLRLRPSDQILGAFAIGAQTSLLLAMQSGKVVNRQTDWLEASASFKTQGQGVLSAERRAKGERLVGAAAVNPQDWAACLASDGSLRLERAGSLLQRGAVLEGAGGLTLVSLATCAGEAP